MAFGNFDKMNSPEWQQYLADLTAASAPQPTFAPQQNYNYAGGTLEEQIANAMNWGASTGSGWDEIGRDGMLSEIAGALRGKGVSDLSQAKYVDVGDGNYMLNMGAAPLTDRNRFSAGIDFVNPGFGTYKTGSGDRTGYALYRKDDGSVGVQTQQVENQDTQDLLTAIAVVGGGFLGGQALGGATAGGAGGAAAGGAGAAEGAAAGMTGAGFGDAGLMYAGADAAAAGTLGGGASVGGGAALGGAGAAGAGGGTSAMGGAPSYSLGGTGSSGTGLTMGGGSQGLTAPAAGFETTASGVGMTGASPGASTIGGGLGTSQFASGTGSLLGPTSSIVSGAGGLGGAGGAGGAAQGASGLSQYLGPAATALGALSGAQGQDASQSSTRAMDPRMDSLFYGDLAPRTQGLLGAQMPQAQQAGNQMLSVGSGLLGQTAPNTATNPYATGILNDMQRRAGEFTDQRLQQTKGNFQAAGGLGGSRQGIAEGTAIAQGLDNFAGQGLNFMGGLYNQDQNRLRQDWTLGAGMMNQGLNTPWAPIQNTAQTYSPFTGFGTTTNNVESGGGWQGALGGALSGAAFGKNMGWWGNGGK